MVMSSSPSTIIAVDRYSSFTKLTRVTAYIHHFIYNCHTCKAERTIGPLTIEKLDRSTSFWISQVQYHHFSKEIKILKQGKSISKSSCLRFTHPYLDPTGLIRMDGCQRNLDTHYD